jgi:hypothetical protein
MMRLVIRVLCGGAMLAVLPVSAMATMPDLECNDPVIQTGFMPSMNATNRYRALGIDIVGVDHITNADVKGWPARMACHATLALSDGRFIPGTITMKSVAGGVLWGFTPDAQ